MPYILPKSLAVGLLNKPNLYADFGVVGLVGYSGFEPLTSSMSRKRSNQLS